MARCRQSYSYSSICKQVKADLCHPCHFSKYILFHNTLYLKLLISFNEKCVTVFRSSAPLIITMFVTIVSILVSLLGGGVALGLLIYWKYPWIGYDILQSFKLMKCLKYRTYLKNKTTTLNIFDQHVKKHPKKNFLLYEESVYSYEEMSRQTHKMGNAGLKMGLKKGSVVAIMMHNEPAFIWTWFGRYNHNLINTST